MTMTTSTPSITIAILFRRKRRRDQRPGTRADGNKLSLGDESPVGRCAAHADVLSGGGASAPPRTHAYCTHDWSTSQ